MNRKAVEIGAFSTNFSNLMDLMLKSLLYCLRFGKNNKYALNIPEFDEIVRKRNSTLTAGY